MHSSLSFLVSGQAQQIFFFGLDSGVVVTADPWFCCEAVKPMAEEELTVGSSPIFTRPGPIANRLLKRRSQRTNFGEQKQNPEKGQLIKNAITGREINI